MPVAETAYIAFGGTVIELLAAIIIALHVAIAISRILTARGSDEARLIIARGVLAALSFSVAGTLLKTIALQSWPEIRTFAFVLLFRTLLKRVFQWEQSKITGRRSLSRRTRSSTPAVNLTALLLAPTLLFPLPRRHWHAPPAVPLPLSPAHRDGPGPMVHQARTGPGSHSIRHLLP